MNHESLELLVGYQGSNIFDTHTVNAHSLSRLAKKALPVDLGRYGYGNFPAKGVYIAASEMLWNGCGVDLRHIDDPLFMGQIINGQHDIVFLAGMDMTLDHIRDILHQIGPSRQTVVCGIGPTAAGNRLLEEFPKGVTVLAGEAEGVVTTLLNDYKTQNQLNRWYERPRPVDLQEYMDEPYMNPSISQRLGGHFNGPFRSFEINRGCGQGCEFCNSHRHHTHKAIGQAIAELRSMPFGVADILFFPGDNMMVMPKNWLDEFFTEVNRLGRHWIGEGTIWPMIKREPALMRKIARNCIGFLVGIEDIFVPPDKAPAKAALQQNLEEAIELTKQARLPVTWSLIFGFDHQGLEYFSGTLDYVLKHRIHVNSHLLRPYIGTGTEKQITAEGRWIDTNSLHRNGDYVVFKPSKMKPEELLAGIMWFRTQYAKHTLARFEHDLVRLGPVKASALAAVDMGGENWGGRRLMQMYPELHKAVENWRS